ncbi:MAG: hypothetical protein H6747_17120 [Deltaproteobacteria bacterium]|nr:hypothetical protein [Deltaproteobacteria bacterium]
MTAIAFRWPRPHPVRARRLAARAALLASLVVAAVALSPRAGLAVEPVLPPSAATQVTALLALDRPLADGTALAAQIEKAQVVVRAGDAASPRLLVRLVHPDAAPAGAFRVGSVALVAEPGPASEADLAELRARLEAGGGALGWVIPLATAKPQPPKDFAAEERALHAAIDASAIALGHKDKAAALQALREVSPPSRPEPRLAYAIALRNAGDEAGAMAALRNLPADAAPDVRAVAAWLRGEAADLDALLAFWPERKVDCGAVAAAHSLHQLQAAELAAALAERIRSGHVDCVAAWVTELRARSDLPPAPAAEAAAAAALAAFPDDPMLLSAAAALSRRHRDWDHALARYEKVGAIQPPVPRVLGHLSNVVMHSGFDREAALQRYRARVAADPNDDVARFMAGVLLHYEDQYEASNEMLRPLVGRRDGEDRLWIYMAMNDFNLGKREQALAVLNRIADGRLPDPDVYYCRAEILRDTDRARAAADLRLYLAGSMGSDRHHEVKEARVRRMLAALEECQRTNPAICESEWEHPRKEREAATRNRLLAAGAAALGLLGAALWLWRRRRTRA